MYRLNIMTWNCNGLNNKQKPLIDFLSKYDIDICMLQETREKLGFDFCFCKFHDYEVYTSPSSSGKANGGTAVLIKNNIKHSSLGGISGDKYQTTVINISTVGGSIKLTSCYISYQAKVNENFFSHLLPVEMGKYIIAGDFNAKHSDWGSITTTSRGNVMRKIIRSNNLKIISPYTPTRSYKYSSSDVLDFAISNYNFDIRGIRVIDDLSSDHLPVIITLNINDIDHLSYLPRMNRCNTCNICKVQELVELENRLKEEMTPKRVADLKQKYISGKNRRYKARRLEAGSFWRREQKMSNLDMFLKRFYGSNMIL